MSEDRKFKSGVFDPKNNTTSNANAAAARIQSPQKKRLDTTLRNKVPQKQDEAQIMDKINKVGSGTKEDGKKRDDAEKANLYTADEQRMVEEMIYRGFCTDEITKEIYTGYEIVVGITSLSNIEFDFANQIIFQLKKESSDDKGFMNISENNFMSLLDGLLLALQIESINKKMIPSKKSDNTKLTEIKNIVKDMTQIEMIGISDKSQLEVLEGIKEDVLDRAYYFLKLDSSFFKFLQNIRFDFNESSQKLMTQDSLIKK